MNKWKKEKMPPYPKDMKELHELILGYDPILPFFKGMATGTDGSIALIFINDIMLTPLNECSQLFCDGTFQCRPRLPKCAQLYTIHFRKIDKGFLAISCLTTKKTKAMYNAIWDKIFGIVPNMKQNVKSITMDFEKAQIASVESKFPDTALVKRWGRAKIGTEYEYLLEQSYAVAHLPDDKIEEGFNSITLQIDCLPDSPQKVKLVLFASYLRRYWLPLAPVLSVYKCKVKTNNSCENFHLNAARILGKRPPIWQFLELLSELMNKYAQDYDRFISGKQPVASLKVDDTSWKTKVAHIEERLRENEVSVRDFIQFIGFSRRVDFCRLHIENAIRGAKDHRDPFEPIVVEEEVVEIDEDTTEDANWILERVVNTPPPVQDLELMPMPENANAQVARRQVARRGGRSNPVVNIDRETAQVARRDGRTAQVAKRGRRSNPVANISRETAQVARRGGRAAQVAKRGRRFNPVANIGREISQVARRGGRTAQVSQWGQISNSVANINLETVQVSTREYATPQVARRGGRTVPVAQWGQRSNSVANINLETVQVSTREYATTQVARRGGGITRSTMRNNPRPATLEFQSRAIDQHLTSAFVHIERLDRLSVPIERDASSETEEEELEHHPINQHRIPGFVPIERFERVASPEPVVEEVEHHAIDQHLM
uniref:MULE transposase domain-containing protein n=1 Tax=Trichogramma kaykai TaxID=54128 RepID=A0ABD2WAQ2_9HYME